MQHRIESLVSQNIWPAVNDGVIGFEEIDKVFDMNTSIVYDDAEFGKITFIYQDANGNYFREEIDLAKFGLDYNYVLDKIRPVFDGPRKQFIGNGEYKILTKEEWAVIHKSTRTY